jgi:hypothetical protein
MESLPPAMTEQSGRRSFALTLSSLAGAREKRFLMSLRQKNGEGLPFCYPYP